MQILTSLLQKLNSTRRRANIDKKDIHSGLVHDARNYGTIGLICLDGRELLWKRENTAFEKIAQTKLKRLKTILDGRKRGNGPW